MSYVMATTSSPVSKAPNTTFMSYIIKSKQEKVFKLIKSVIHVTFHKISEAKFESTSWC